MAEALVTDKRRYARLDLKGRVIVKTKSGRMRIMKASMDNLSFGGFHIYSPQNLKAEEDIEFELKTKLLEKPLSGKAKIRRVERVENSIMPTFSTGIEVMQTEKDTLIGLIRRHLKRKDKVIVRRNKFMQNLTLFIKLAPLLIAFSWLVVKFSDGLISGINENNEYNKQFQKAVVHYLYNAR